MRRTSGENQMFNDIEFLINRRCSPPIPEASRGLCWCPRSLVQTHHGWQPRIEIHIAITLTVAYRSPVAALTGTTPGTRNASVYARFVFGELTVKYELLHAIQLPAFPPESIRSYSVLLPLILGNTSVFSPHQPSSKEGATRISVT